MWVCCLCLVAVIVRIPETHTLLVDSRYNNDVSEDDNKDTVDAEFPDPWGSYGVEANPPNKLSVFQEKLGRVRRRPDHLSSVLPPWTEFCRMLNMRACNRYKRTGIHGYRDAVLRLRTALHPHLNEEWSKFP